MSGRTFVCMKQHDDAQRQHAKDARKQSAGILKEIQVG